jgi:hypothetical protein
MSRMANALRFLPSRRALSIMTVALAAILVILVALALWNPWRFTILFPLSHQAVAVGVLVLAGALVAATAVTMFADNGRKAVIALIACLVAVPAFCVGLPTVALDKEFKAAAIGPTVTMAQSPSGLYIVVKSTFDTDAGRRTRLFVRSDSLFLGRESAVPLAECDIDPFEDGLPPEAVRFTGESTVAVPVRGQDTAVVAFNLNTLKPDRTVDMCSPGS